MPVEGPHLTKEEMNGCHFQVEDNPDKIFSTDDVRITFRKDARVSRVWTMSDEELAELQTAITSFLTEQQDG